MSANTIVTLKTSTGAEVKATLLAVKQSGLITSILDDLNWDETTNPPIPIPTFTGEALEKVMEWCEHHQGDEEQGGLREGKMIGPLSVWYEQFFDQLDKEMLSQITCAADNLKISRLMLHCMFVLAQRMEGMAIEQQYEYLGLGRDSTVLADEDDPREG